MLTSLGRHCDLALLLTRFLFGFTLLFAHGGPKLMSADLQARVGQAMETFGITFGFRFWGMMAGITEVTAGVLFIIGFGVRPAAIAMLFIMFVAISQAVARTGGVLGSTPAVDAAAGYIALVAFGAGRYSLDRKLGLDRRDAARVAAVRAKGA